MTHRYTPRHLLSLSACRFRALVLGLVLGASSLALTQAQTLGIALAFDGRAEPEVQLRNLETSFGTLDLRLADGLAGALEIGVAGTVRSTFGPLGTAALGVQLDLDTLGALDLGARATGTLGSGAVDARLAIFNRNPGAFSAVAAYQLGSRPFLPLIDGREAVATATHLELEWTQRLGRTLFISAEPLITVASGRGVGAGLNGALEFRRVIGRDNAALVLNANTGPGPDLGYAAAGGRYDLNRRGLPTLSGALLLGSGATGVLPGLRASASGTLAELSYRAELSAEPYLSTAPPYRASVALAAPIGPGAVGLELGAALANPYNVPPATLRTSYALRF